MPHTAALTSRSRRLALAVLCAGMLMVILDGSIVTVALPVIQNDLGFSSAGLTWVVNAYLIAFGGLLLLAGRLGDLVGRKRVFIAGLAIFTAASLLCGVSTNEQMLIAARFVQGIGGEPGHDRHAVPGAARARRGHRRLQLRRRRGRLHRPGSRRDHHPDPR